jgi:assimilatory nitrate reductase catalytic subunit
VTFASSNFTGIDHYCMLDDKRGIQWSLPDGQVVEPLSERRLFEDGEFFTPDQRARFVFEAPRPLPEPTTSAYPFTLLTGRGSSSQWHTQTRTGKSDVLRKLYPNVPDVELSPRDAANLGIDAHEWGLVRSQRAQVRARAFISHVVQPGHVFLPMHDAMTNQLTFAAFDPYSRQPSYKACAVRIEPAPNG